MTTNNILGVTVSLSGVDSDGARWSGRVTFERAGETVSAKWIGADSSDMGELVDVEGEIEELCLFIEAHAAEIESAITGLLGDPCDDETGRRAMFAAIEEERAAHEARMGVAA